MLGKPLGNKFTSIYVSLKRPKRPPSSAAGGIKDYGSAGGDTSGTGELESGYNATTTVKTDLVGC